uniref:WD repeat-containing protein 47 n=1 Tax=Romanomermis culicivorax TaxID=13658 RepID=A0A915HFV3_ROMCU
MKSKRGSPLLCTNQKHVSIHKTGPSYHRPYWKLLITPFDEEISILNTLNSSFDRNLSSTDPVSTSISSVRSSIHRQTSDEACNSSRVKFVPICRLEDQQAVRTSAFHPSGRYFAVGTNSRQLHKITVGNLHPNGTKISLSFGNVVSIAFRSPKKAVFDNFNCSNNRADYQSKAPEILLTRPKQHRGSVYTVAFNPSGELLATGSNDKTIRLMQFSAENCRIGSEFDLTFHDGTVRDIIFMEDTTNNTSLLISGGAGNCKINVIDCATGGRLRALDGHTAPILGLYTWGGCMFVSCSQDKTTKFWDLRCGQVVATIYPDAKTSSSPVTSVCVDVTGRLLASGHEDSTILLYDIQGSRMLQRYQAHGDQVRTVRFSPGNYYLLSGSYDKKIVITDMRGDLMGNLQYLPVAEHGDKIIQCRWHPHDFTFLSTSADKSVILWSLPAVVQ